MPLLDSQTWYTDLRRALAHLDDPLYLENLSLARDLSVVAQTPDLSKGQALQRVLRLAIASLDPAASRDGDSVQVPCYQVLYRYAVGRQSMVAIARQLGISERHGYRQLYRAMQALVQMLHELTGEPRQAPRYQTQDTSGSAVRVRAELDRLATLDKQDVDLGSLITGVVESARSLALERGISIELMNETDEPVHVATNRVMLRQAILNLLSHVATVHSGDTIQVRMLCSNKDAMVSIAYHPENSPADMTQPQGPYAIAAQILGTLGLDWASLQDSSGITNITVRVPLSHARTVLIVDDNEGIIALFKRYLHHQPYAVYGARNPQEVAEALAQLKPDVVILDIMLPNQDGWEVLQALRATEGGQLTRVIVCSIINDPRLAAALGADAFLHKPVDRARLLQALAQVLAPDS